MLNRQKYIEGGKILKPFKAGGMVKAGFYYPLDSLPLPGEFLFIEMDKKPVPFFIESSEQLDNKTMAFKLEDIDNRDEAKELGDKAILLNVDDLAPGHPVFYVSEITDYKIFDLTSNTEAPILSLIDSPGQQLLEIQLDNRNQLIPFHEDFIERIDQDTRTITMKLPGGILNDMDHE